MIPPSSKSVSTSRAVPLSRSPRRARISSQWCLFRTALVLGNASQTSALNRSCQLSGRVCTSPVSKIRTSYWAEVAGGTNRIGAPPPLTTDGVPRALSSSCRGSRSRGRRPSRGVSAVKIGASGAGMRRAVGAEEEFRIAARRRANQRLAVLLALQHRQTVIVRPDAAREHRAAVVEQVVRCDRGGNVRPPRQHELHSLAGGHVLDHDAKPRETAGDLGEDRLEKHALAIENIHARSRDLTVNEQGQHLLFHGRESQLGGLAGGDTGLRIRPCSSR